MKTAIFGGSFDPVHVGHVALLKVCQEKLRFDRVLLVPTARPPHKEKIHAPDVARLEMLRLAFQGFDNDNLEIDARELQKKSPSYTFDLLTDLSKDPRYSQSDFYFLLGEDSAFDLPNWYRFPEVMDLARWVAVSRKGTVNREEKWETLKRKIKEARRDVDKIIRIEGDLPEVSSTQLRRLLSQNVQSAQADLPAAVMAYLKTTNPYANSGS